MTRLLCFHQEVVGRSQKEPGGVDTYSIPGGVDIYSRHRDFWGEEKQKIIEKSSIFIAGMGGLGCTVSQILVRVGIGRLYIVDCATIDPPDLNRQSLYFAKDRGKKKVLVACERLKSISHCTEIVAIDKRIEKNFRICQEVDGVADCLDNYRSRFFLEESIPKDKFYVHGGVMGDYGQVITLHKGKSKPLSRIYENYDQIGAPPVIPEIVFTIASIMAKELIYNLWGEPRLLNRFLIAEFSDFTFSFLDIEA